MTDNTEELATAYVGSDDVQAGNPLRFVSGGENCGERNFS